MTKYIYWTYTGFSFPATNFMKILGHDPIPTTPHLPANKAHARTDRTGGGFLSSLTPRQIRIQEFSQIRIYKVVPNFVSYSIIYSLFTLKREFCETKFILSPICEHRLGDFSLFQVISKLFVNS